MIGRMGGCTKMCCGEPASLGGRCGGGSGARRIADTRKASLEGELTEA